MKTISLLLCSLLIYGTAFSQNLIKGQITDLENEPLVGATVLQTNTLSGTITDANGFFELYTEELNPSLTCSYTGFKTQEIQATQNFNSIVLELDITQFEAVNVVGFIGAVGQARRRAVSTQKIPESVVTFTSEHIEQTGISTIDDFASQIPNVSFSTYQNLGVNFLSVRGIPQIRNGESPVAFLIDGITIQDPNLLNQELFDLAMIEVVKGPQGTLYGKNAIAGAINILTLAPTNQFKNKIKIGYGNGNSYKGVISSSGPLMKDKIFYGIAGNYKNRDGLIQNEFLNEKVDFYEDFSFRGQLKFDFTNNFTASLVGQYSDTDGGATYLAR